METKTEAYTYRTNCYKECSSVMAEQHEEMDIDDAFYHTKASTFTYVGYVGDRAMVNIPMIKPVVDKVSGLARQLRRTVSFSARDSRNEVRMMLSDLMNKADEMVRDDCGMDILESDQDLDMFKLGVGALDVEISWLSGAAKLTAEVVDPRMCWWDVSCATRNMNTRMYDGRWKILPVQTALDLFPGTTCEDFDPAPLDGWNKYLAFTKNRDIPAYQDPRKNVPVKRNYGNNAEATYEQDARNVVVEVFRYKKLEKFRKYRNPAFDLTPPDPQVDPQGYARTIAMAQFIQDAIYDLRDSIRADMDKSDDYESGYKFDIAAEQEFFDVPNAYASRVDDLLGQFLPDGTEPDYDTFTKYVRRTGFMGRDKCLKVWRSISQDQPSLQLKTGNYDRETRTWYGLTRQLREPALFMNKALTDHVYTVAHRAKGGGFVKRGQNDTATMERDYARPDSIIELDDPQADFRPKNEGGGDTGLEGLIAMFEGFIAKAVGLNPEYLGTSDLKDANFAFEAQRIRQVSASLAMYFDSISMYGNDCARLRQDNIRYMVRVNPSFEVELKDDDGNLDFVQLTEDMVDIDYSVQLTETNLSPIMKEQLAKVMSDTGLAVMQITGNVKGVAESADGWEVYGATHKQIQKFKDAIQPPEPTPEQQAQQQQMQAQQMQMAMEGAMAKIDKDKADAEAKRAGVAKTGAETERTALETQVLLNKPIMEVSASV